MMYKELKINSRDKPKVIPLREKTGFPNLGLLKAGNDGK